MRPTRAQRQQCRGQASVNYTHDDANRLIQIQRGSLGVSFRHDAANRRSGLTLPNGISASYAYDNASRLSNVTYTLGATVLGDLNYRYDANGNLQSDGANSYTWDSRNQLTGINGASFQYDASGRRSRKTVNGVTTQYLYDGVTPVQELNASNSASANILTGPGMGEYYARIDSSGAKTFLPDALGNSTRRYIDNTRRRPGFCCGFASAAQSTALMACAWKSDAHLRGGVGNHGGAATQIP